MALHLDIVVDNSAGVAADRRQQSLRLIGEILPFVLAKYQDEFRAPSANRQRAEPQSPPWTNRLPQ